MTDHIDDSTEQQLFRDLRPSPLSAQRYNTIHKTLQQPAQARSLASAHNGEDTKVRFFLVMIAACALAAVLLAHFFQKENTHNSKKIENQANTFSDPSNTTAHLASEEEDNRVSTARKPEITYLPMFQGGPTHTGYFPNGLGTERATKSDPILFCMVRDARGKYLICAINSKTGEQLWCKEGNQITFCSALTIVDGQILSGGSQNLYAYNALSGIQLWKAQTGTLRGCVVEKNTIYCSTNNGDLLSISAETGKFNWSYKITRMLMATPAVQGNRIFIGSSAGEFSAFDVSTGDQLWKYTPNRRMSPFDSPAVVGDTVYIGSQNHSLYAFDIETGAQRWAYETNNRIIHSPAVSGNDVVFGSTDGNVYAVDARSGELKWKSEIETDRNDRHNPAIYQQSVYIRGSDQLYCFDLSNGNLRWKAQVGNDLLAKFIVGHSMVFAVNHGVPNKIVAFDSNTGKELWSKALSSLGQQNIKMTIISNLALAD